jgi:serine/threonine protein kinase
MYDSFVLFPKTPRGKLHFCTVFELAGHGDLVSYLERTQRGWTETRIKREVGALLHMLDQLHGGNATHRDITPMNIFVCRSGILKLGDFGIAQHELDGFLTTIEAYNHWFIPPRFFERSHPHWEPGDDTYQMGHVIAMLVSGQAEEKITLRSVDKLTCNKNLKAIIKRAIGPRKQRFADAYDMLQALQGKRDPVKISLQSFNNKKVVFTGKLSISRFDAQVLVLQAGATIGKKMGPNVDVLVIGKRSPRFKKGHKSSKLLDAEKLIKKGRKIHIIGEREFRRLIRKERF